MSDDAISSAKKTVRPWRNLKNSVRNIFTSHQHDKIVKFVNDYVHVTLKQQIESLNHLVTLRRPTPSCLLR